MSDAALPRVEVNEPAPTARIRRIFEFNGARLADPGPHMSAEEVRKLYASSGYPTLTNASVTGPVRQGNNDVFTFKAAVGTKG